MESEADRVATQSSTTTNIVYENGVIEPMEDTPMSPSEDSEHAHQITMTGLRMPSVMATETIAEDKETEVEAVDIKTINLYKPHAFAIGGIRSLTVQESRNVDLSHYLTKTNSFRQSHSPTDKAQNPQNPQKTLKRIDSEIRRRRDRVQVKNDPKRNASLKPSKIRPMALQKTLSMQTGFPVIFDPDCFYHGHLNPETSQSSDVDAAVDQYVHYCNIVKSMMQSVTVLGFGGVLLAAMSIWPNHPERWWSVSFLTLWVIYATLILNSVRSRADRGIYRILTQSSIPPKYPRISMAAKQYIYMNQPINSLSELCHIEGSTTTLGFTFCSSMVWVSILFFLITMKYKNKCQFELQFTDILMYIGGSCMYGVQLFKLDPFHDTMKYLHGIVTASGGVFVTVVYFCQQISLGGYHWVSAAAISLIGWPSMYLAIYHFGTFRHDQMVEKYKDIAVNEMTEEIRKEISAFSQKIIWFEVTAVMCLSITVSLWMWQYDQPCAYGCIGPAHFRADDEQCQY